MESSDTLTQERATEFTEEEVLNGDRSGTETPDLKPPAPRRGKRFLVLGGVILLLVLLVPFMARWISFNRAHATTDDATVDGDLYPVSPKVSGRVQQVFVGPNERVKRGQLLVTLDDRDLRVQLDQAKAALAMEEANAKAAGVNIAITQKSTNSATGQAQAALEASRAQLEATRQQAQAGLTQITASQAGLDAAREGVSDARSSLKSTQAGLNSSRAALASAEEGVNVAKQGVTGAQAAVRAAQQGVKVAAADVTAAEAGARKTASDLSRARSLVQQGAISRSQLDAAQAAGETSAAQVSAARQRFEAAKAGVEQARAALATAQSSVAQAASRSNQARAGVDQAQAAVQSAGNAILTAQAKVRQSEAGVAETRSTVSGLKANVAQQQAKVAESVAGLQETAAAPERLNVSQAQAQTATAQVQQARARVEELQLQLSYTRITAPHDGIVSRKNVSEGQTVQIGQGLLTVTDLSEADVIANFKETQLPGIHEGSLAEFTVDAYPGRVFKGHVSSLSAGTGAVYSLLPPENASGNFTKVVQRVPIKIAIDSGIDKAHPLRMGMSTVVTVTTGS